MDCIVSPMKGNQVGFSKTIDANRMLPNFMNMIFFFFINSELLLFSLADEYHTAPTKHLENFTDLNRILRLEIFLHKDSQLRAAHVILNTSLPPNVSKARITSLKPRTLDWL